MRIPAALLFLALPVFSLGQSAPVTSGAIDSETAAQHIVDRPLPAYPPIARAAHVEGTVRVQIQIDPAGHVVQQTVLSGPAMLVGAATDALAEWTFSPFLVDGKPSTVSTYVDIPFGLHDPELLRVDRLRGPLFQLNRDCSDLLQAKGKAEKAAEKCREAADEALKVPEDKIFLSTRLRLAAMAYERSGQFSLSLQYADRAVATAGPRDKVGAYEIRSQCRAANRDVAGAESDAAAAEDLVRSIPNKTLADGKPSPQYQAELKAALQLHAAILKIQSRNEESAAKLEEASNLK